MSIVEPHMAAGTPRVPGPVAGAPYYPVTSPLGVPVVAGRVTPGMAQPVPRTAAVELALRTPVPNLAVPAAAPAHVYRLGVGEWTEYWSPERPHPASVLWLKEAMTRGPGPQYRPELGDNWWWGLYVKNPQYAQMNTPNYLTGLVEPGP